MSTPKERARALYEARGTRTPIAPFTQADPALTAADGYAIQTELVDLLLADGDRIVGYKLGLTSRVMQEAFGVFKPDYGPVLASTVLDDGADVDLSAYHRPRVEAEIALVLDRPLRGPGLDTAAVADAVAGATAAIEFIDTRFTDWKIKLPDTIADLASSAAIVRGSRVVPLDFDLRLCGMVITRNGETVATGAGAAALGNPVAAVAWLANTLAPFGVTLEPGHIVMTGALHAAFSVAPGDVVVAEFDRLGAVSMSFKG